MNTISTEPTANHATDLANYNLSTTDEAARHFRRGVELLLALQPGAGNAFAAAVESDATFALSHASLAVTRSFYGQPGDPVEAITTAMSLRERSTRRERQHVEALATMLRGDVAAAGTLAAEHLAEFPRDHVIAYLAVMGSHWYGDQAARHAAQQIVGNAARHAPDDDWAFHAIHAFVLEEQLQLDQAEHHARRSLAVRPDSGEAAHVLAHVLYEQGRHDEGLDFIEQWTADHYRPDAPNWVHIQWHATLFELELDRADQALARYRRHISPVVAGAGALTDATALLWRLWLDEHPDLPVDDLAEPAAGAARHLGWTFADWHTGLALALTRQRNHGNEMISKLDEFANAGHPSAALASHVTQAAFAMAEGASDVAVGHLSTALDRRTDLGGSHAQLDIMDQTVIHAQWRAGDVDHARAALETRRRWPKSARERRLLEAVRTEMSTAGR